MMQSILFVLLCQLTPWYQDAARETLAERHERFGHVVKAIDGASGAATCLGRGPDCERLWPGSREDLAVLVLAIGYLESRYALHVHQDKCRITIGECDAGRAKSSWQIQPTGIIPYHEWRTIGGVDSMSTKRAVWAATRVVSHAHSRCGSIQGTFAAYAGKGNCRWSKARDRLLFFEALRRKYDDVAKQLHHG